MWKPLRVMVIGTQTNSSEVLLTHQAKGCLNLCQSLRQVSKVQQYYQATVKRVNPNDSPWLFAQWGLDIIGSFPIAVRQLKFLILGIDYFTKWVEAEALATITERNMQSFVWRFIICRFGISKV